MRSSARALHALVAGTVASAVILPSPAFASGFSVDVASFQEPMDKARELYTEGESLYSAADYNGAITKFTEALTIVSKHGSVDDAQVRGLIMFNIAKAHIEAYEVDDQVNHLRQARSIYKRFVTEGEAAGYNQSDIDDAQAHIDELEARIEEIEEAEKAAAPAPVPVGGGTGGGVDVDKLDKAQKAFGLGIGLTITGAVLFGGGIGMVAWGASVDNFIEDEINKKRKADCNDGLSSCKPPLNSGEEDADDLTPEEKNFRDQEELKGNIWIGAGAAALALGIAGIGVGAWQLSVSKKLKAESISVTPAVNRETAGVLISGRFGRL